MRFIVLYFGIVFVFPSMGFAGDCRPGSSETRWSIDQVAALAHQKFSCDDLAQAIALAHAESGFRPYCVSEEGSSLLGDYSEDSGLWQMNDLRGNLEFEFGGEPQDQTNPKARACGIDPQCNLDYTYRLWVKDNGFHTRRWHAFGNEDYQTELGLARKFIKENLQYSQGCH